VNSNYIKLGAYAGLLMLMAISYGVHAAECTDLIGCSSGGGDSWDPMQKLDEIGNPQAEQSQAPSASIPALSRVKRWNMSAYGFEDGQNKSSQSSAQEASSEAAQNNVPAKPAPAKGADENINVASQRSERAVSMLVPIDDATNADILLDVSENSSKHIRGSVVLPYTEFALDMNTGALKSVDEVAKILGNAGISQNDSVLIYGECLPCGGGPSLATYVYWIMKSLGHEKVKVLDGNVENWEAKGLPITSEAKILLPKNYTPNFTRKYTAAYDYVKDASENGYTQIIDARTPAEYGSGNILGSINIPYDNVLNNKSLKSDDSLKKAFAILDKDRPVVVYTNTGVKASVVWFALEMTGYDAKLYSLADWIMNQPSQGNSTNNTA
jgi:thiosulfate/3-mercaptopyruvate sulfurtransferase